MSLAWYPHQVHNLNLNGRFPWTKLFFCLHHGFSLCRASPSPPPWVSHLTTPAMTNGCGDRHPRSLSVHALVSNFINPDGTPWARELWRCTRTTHVWGELVTWAGPTNLLTVQLWTRCGAVFTRWHLWTVPKMQNCALMTGKKWSSEKGEVHVFFGTTTETDKWGSGSSASGRMSVSKRKRDGRVMDDYPCILLLSVAF